MHKYNNKNHDETNNNIWTHKDQNKKNMTNQEKHNKTQQQYTKRNHDETKKEQYTTNIQTQPEHWSAQTSGPITATSPILILLFEQGDK